MMSLHRLLLAAALGLPAPALAAELTVTDAFSRATPTATVPGVAYFTIHGGDGPDRLLRASSPVARVELHTMTTEGNVMRMREVDGIDVPAGSTVKLAPGGLHVMLVGLKAPLKQGETVPLTLVFEHAGERRLDVPVAALGANGPAR